jgi:hypothetical protein
MALLSYILILKHTIVKGNLKGGYHMPFVDNISKFAKSVSDSAVNAAKKSGELVEVTKLNMSIQTEEEKIKELYSQIGSIFYKKYSDKEDIDEEFVSIINDVKSCEEAINNLKQQMLSIKKVKVCGTCGSELEPEDVFCKKCGTKQG